MMGLSFFTGSFRTKSLTPYLRGVQVAEYLGAKLNPINGYENDICILVKKLVRRFPCKDLFVDVVDGLGFLPRLYQRPYIGIIASSKVSYNYFTENFKNRVVLIPHHHCNFERKLRNRPSVSVAGYIGGYLTFQPFEDEIREKLKSIGIDLLFCHEFRRRWQVMDFYNKIDVQVIWRVMAEPWVNHKNPLKISNAGSFGIPTVAFPEKNFVAEYDGCFIPANTIDELVKGVALLKNNPGSYGYYSRLAQDRAENYHIEHIAPLYQRLEEYHA